MMKASDPATGKRGRQWREEYQLATCILKCFQKDLELKDTPRFVARTNSVKCCANRHHSNEAPPRLFHNCRKYLPREIELLAPDILVTQGHQAENAVKLNFNNNVKLLHWISRDPKWYSSVITVGHKEVLWLRMPFPKSYKYHPKAVELDRRYAQCAQEVMSFFGRGL